MGRLTGSCETLDTGQGGPNAAPIAISTLTLRLQYQRCRKATPGQAGQRALPIGDTARVSSSKVASMHDAIATLVRDGDSVAIEGFTHLIGFAAGHEIIRQGRRDLTLARLTPDLVYDQMVAAGVARKLIFSWLGNPGVGSLHAIRRRVEAGGSAARTGSRRLELEE